jgi:hypothetical protein
MLCPGIADRCRSRDQADFWNFIRSNPSSAAWRGCGLKRKMALVRPDGLAVWRPGETRVGRKRPKQQGRAPGRTGCPSRRCGRVRRLDGVATASAGVVHREWPDLCLHRGSPSTAVRPAARRHVDPGRAWTVGVGPIGRSAGALTQAESRSLMTSRWSASTRCAATRSCSPGRDLDPARERARWSHQPSSPPAAGVRSAAWGAGAGDR